jgi:hypothetical protein
VESVCEEEFLIVEVGRLDVRGRVSVGSPASHVQVMLSMRLIPEFEGHVDSG